MKKKYFKNNNKKMSGYFNKRTWDMMTPAEQLMWEPLDGGWDNERKFSLYRDDTIIRFFSERVWSILPEEEQERWKPLGDWPELSGQGETSEERRKRRNENEKKHGMNNLRLKEGQSFNLMGTILTIIRWGPRRHLVSFHRKGYDKVKYGTLTRETEDSSWGDRDVMGDHTNYSSHKTLEQAEQEYSSANR